MSQTNRKFHFTIAKLLHWTVAFFAALLLLSAWQVDNLSPESKLWFMMVHSSLGSLIFVLMIFRWYWNRKHKLYSPPGWYKRPSVLLQRLFYPLLLIQPVIGVTQAAFVEYDILGFGLINYSAIAAENKDLFTIFHELHVITALAIVFVLFIHIIDKSRRFFIEDSAHL